MPKLFQHEDTGIMTWANSDDIGHRWYVCPSCWLDELPRPFKDEKEKIQWIENSIVLNGKKIGPQL